MLSSSSAFPNSAVPSFSHLNAAERRQVALRSRYIFVAVILFTAVAVIASVVNYSSAILLSSETHNVVRAARPTFSTIVTPHHFNVAGETETGTSHATSAPHLQSVASVPPAIAKIIMALGAAEIASLVHNTGEVLSPHSAKLQANKITGAIILEFFRTRRMEQLFSDVGVQSLEHRKQLVEKFSTWLQDLEILNAAMKDLSNRAAFIFSASHASSSSPLSSSSSSSSPSPSSSSSAAATASSSLPRPTNATLHVWTDDQAFQPPPNEACFMKQVMASGQTFDMCLRSGNDLISNVIKSAEGRWPDCDRLPPMYSRPLVAEKADCPNSNSVTLDVGANIGSCTLMLAMLGKKVVAFEPNPHNLFFLTNSIKRLPQQHRERLTLHAAGAGASAGVHKLFTQQGNFGNSILDNPNQSDNSPLHTVFTVTLDDALWPDPSLPPPCIPLMKMDVQGFEVQALQGAKRLLAAKAIKRISTEVAPSFLAAQGTKASELVKLLSASGFHFENHLNLGSPDTLNWLDAQATMNPFHGIDIIASL